MILKRPTNDGNFSPGGSSNVKYWNIVVKNRNNSIRAKASPRHALLPEIKLNVSRICCQLDGLEMENK